MSNKQTPIEKAIDLIDGFLTQLDDIAESKNKQSMKLYTEEQMHTVMLLALGKYQIHSNRKVLKENQDLIDSLTPIELPSDEEIEDRSGFEYPAIQQDAFIVGAKWMRDKIGGNK